MTIAPQRPTLSLLTTLSIIGLTAVPGCRQLFEGDFRTMDVPLDRLREIEQVNLRDRSTAEPTTVEAAADDLLSRVAREADDGIAEYIDQPGDTVMLSLADVRVETLRNNLDLRVELVNPALALADVNVEEAKFESTFNASIRRSITDSPTVLATQSGQSEFDQYSLGLNVPLRTGGTATIDLPFSKTDQSNAFLLLNPAYNSDLRFTLTQPLLRGAWPRANTHSIRVAKYQQQITETRTKLEAIRILSNAEKAYWNLYAAQGELEVRYRQYELAVTQLKTAQRRVNAGDVAQIEVTRAQSGVAQSLEGIIIAKTTMDRTQRDLKRIINREGLPVGSDTTLRLDTPAAPLGLDLAAETLAEYAVRNRMEMLEQELQLAIDASSIDFQRNQALPLLVLDYSYGINGLGSTFNNSFGQIADRSFEDWSLGLRTEIPLGNEAAESRVQRAILQRLQRLATRAQRELSIRQEVYDTVDVLEQAWQRIVAAHLEVLTAQRTYEAEQRQFGVGERTSTDVLDAAARLADAESRKIRAMADYQIAQVDIAFATGTTLGSGRVIWEPVSIEGDE